jgi:hypothetical protein
LYFSAASRRSCRVSFLVAIALVPRFPKFAIRRSTL